MAAHFPPSSYSISGWFSINNSSAVFPNQNIVYMIRNVDCNRNPLKIQHARQEDLSGIINIGSGNGIGRIYALQISQGINHPNQWIRRNHHQLMLWYVTFNFDSLPNFNGMRNFEVAWILCNSKEDARALEAKLLWEYKEIFGDLPITNLKTY